MRTDEHTLKALTRFPWVENATVDIRSAQVGLVGVNLVSVPNEWRTYPFIIQTIGGVRFLNRGGIGTMPPRMVASVDTNNDRYLTYKGMDVRIPNKVYPLDPEIMALVGEYYTHDVGRLHQAAKLFSLPPKDIEYLTLVGKSLELWEGGVSEHEIKKFYAHLRSYMRHYSW